MNRLWTAAAVPLALMLLMFYGCLMRPWRDITTEFWPSVAIPAGALLTGLCVLFVVVGGWRRGAYALRRGDIPAATVLAALDVLVPATLALLLWPALRNMKHGLLFRSRGRTGRRALLERSSVEGRGKIRFTAADTEDARGSTES